MTSASLATKAIRKSAALMPANGWLDLSSAESDEFDPYDSVAICREPRINTKHPAVDANAILEGDPNLRMRSTRKFIMG
jgi:hypothetical protein